eukprot:1176452-Prorocentrum_minimum.AAC.2
MHGARVRNKGSRVVGFGCTLSSSTLRQCDSATDSSTESTKCRLAINSVADEMSTNQSNVPYSKVSEGQVGTFVHEVCLHCPEGLRHKACNALMSLHAET